MILVVSAAFPPEPVVAASMTLDLAEALAEKCDVVIITPEPTRPLGFCFGHEKPERRKFEHIILKSFTYPKSKLAGRILESYSFGKHAADFIKKERYNIQSCYVNAWPLVAQFMIIRILKSFSIPAVTHIQDIYPECFTKKVPVIGNFLAKAFLPLDQYILKNSSKIITISFGMKNHLVTTRDLEETKVIVVPNWQDEGLFVRCKKSVSKENKRSLFTFMFLGNLSATAAIHTLINAFNESGIGNSRLIIAGNGSEKENLIALADNCKESNIEFWDATRQEVPEIQGKADVLLLSLKKDTARFALPSKLPAYMFSKKPVIACVDENSDTALAIKQADCGWIVSPEDTDELAGVMKTIASIKPKELINYGENGFKYAMTNYTKQHNLQKLVSVIIETVNHRLCLNHG